MPILPMKFRRPQAQPAPPIVPTPPGPPRSPLSPYRYGVEEGSPIGRAYEGLKEAAIELNLSGNIKLSALYLLIKF